jgi:2-hydroxyacyl-CoA lyase 1
MANMNGAEILTKQLKNEGVDVVFSLTGDPMAAIHTAMREQGTRRINFRHEQASALAAQAYGYVTRKPAVAMVPSGPGMTNAITALETARSNCWPFLLIAGNGDLSRRFRGDFQEAPQVEAAAPFCKWSISVDDPRQIPYYVHSAMTKMMNGRPMPVFLDLPSNVITAQVREEDVLYYPPAPPIPRPTADPHQVKEAVKLISEARNPLLLLGKGVAWSDAADEVRELVDRLQIPFVPSPMGKGIVPDDHPLNAQGARSFALQNADLVVLAGARFNWLFHFGEPPRFAPSFKVIQIDIDPGELGNGVPAEVGLAGDAKAVFRQMLDEIGQTKSSIETPWLQSLESEKKKNADAVAEFIGSDQTPMNMYRMYREVVAMMDRDATITADGENAMAISRVMVPNYLPRHRLDGGVSGCMGVSVPYALGAQVATPGKQVVSFNGDYAFGWNGFEAETAVRNDLPIVFIVANNVSVGGPDKMELPNLVPNLGYQPEGIRYDKIMEAFGGHGEHVERPEELRPALERAISSGKAALINVVIDKRPARKKQEHHWMTGRSDRMSY